MITAENSRRKNIVISNIERIFFATISPIMSIDRTFSIINFVSRNRTIIKEMPRSKKDIFLSFSPLLNNKSEFFRVKY